MNTYLEQPHPQDHAPGIPCRRCSSTTLIPLQKARADDNDVFRCAHCGFIFSPPVTQARPAGCQEVS